MHELYRMLVQPCAPPLKIEVGGIWVPLQVSRNADSPPPRNPHLEIPPLDYLRCSHLLLQRKSPAREYVPAYRSGPYALLIALHNAREVFKVGVWFMRNIPWLGNRKAVKLTCGGALNFFRSAPFVNYA